MRRIHDRVGGLDVHRDSVVACAQMFDGHSVEIDKATFATTAKGVRELGEWLAVREVELVVMEATGLYWRPVNYYGLEDRFGELWLVNAHHVKNVRGRKTDMSDAEWLADVALMGFRPSFMPPVEIRGLREPDPLPQYPDPGPGPRDPTTGEAPPGCRQQADVGGVDGVVPVEPVDGRDAHRRPDRPGGAGRAGQWADAPQDPCAERSCAGSATAVPPTSGASPCTGPATTTTRTTSCLPAPSSAPPKTPFDCAADLYLNAYE